MSVLFSKPEYNWLPKNSVHFKLVDDILLCESFIDKWMVEQAREIEQMHLYTFDLRMRSTLELQQFKEGVEAIIQAVRERMKLPGNPFLDEEPYLNELEKLINLLALFIGER
jgi:hypothetical protein